MSFKVKNIVSIILGLSMVSLLCTILYYNIDFRECKNTLKVKVFEDKRLRIRNGLPFFEKKYFKKRIKNNGFKIELLNQKNKFPLLKEMIYYCHTNSIQDTYLLNSELSIVCELYFNEPKRSRFTKIENNKRKIIGYEEALKTLVDFELFNKNREVFYGDRIIMKPDSSDL